MPYSKKAKFTHHRQRKPSLFVKGTLRTITIKRVKDQGLYSGKKFNKKGVKAVVGKLKKSKKYAVQSFLVPKKK